MNKIVISPSELNSAPSTDILKLHFESLSKNFYEKFTLCGMMIDINKNLSFIPINGLKNQDFFILTNINPTFDVEAQTNILMSARKALCKSSSILNITPPDELQLKLTTDNQNIFTFDNFNFKDMRPTA